MTEVAGYAPTPLLRRHALDVGHGHVLNIEEYGVLDGIAALVLHGGPGSGCTPLLRRFFDPQRYRVICPDQRGAGRSRPRGAIDSNTTTDLLEDLRVLREYLGVSRWLVVGGSWGAALALAHAAAQPDAIQALLLRATFLARRADIERFFQGADDPTSLAWQDFAAAPPPDERDALLPWLARTLASGAPAEQARAAIAWWCWEFALSGTTADVRVPSGEALAALVDRYRVQSHYLLNACWLDAPPLLERCAALPRVPTLLLHARDDRVCLPEGALSLHARIAHSALRWVELAGHDPAHPAMTGAMVAALDRYAGSGDFALAA